MTHPQRSSRLIRTARCRPPAVGIAIAALGLCWLSVVAAPAAAEEGRESWQDVVDAARAYEASPNDETARALRAIALRWLERDDISFDLRLDLLRLSIEIGWRTGEYESVVRLASRHLPEVAGEFRLWLLEQQGHALIRLERLDEVDGVIAALRATSGERRLVVGADRAVWSIERALRLRPGAPPPDIALPDIDGADVSLAEFEGRPVVLVFWTSWHPLCRELIALRLGAWATSEPSADEGEAAAPPAVLLISAQPRAEQMAFRDAHDVPWQMLVDEAGKVTESYRIRAVPYVVHIHASGAVARAGLAGDVLADIESSLGLLPLDRGSETNPAESPRAAAPAEPERNGAEPRTSERQE